MSKWILKQLKPLEKIVDENTRGKWYKPYEDEDEGMYDWEYTDNDMIWWHINDEMLKIFGDGHFYGFTPIRQHTYREGKDMSYTHEGEDSYLYNESWFEHDVILELDDKDFML